MAKNNDKRFSNDLEQLNEEKLRRLREVVAKATPWGKPCPEKVYIFDGDSEFIAEVRERYLSRGRYNRDQSEGNYDFLYTFSPSQVTALLDELESLRSQATEQAALAKAQLDEIESLRSSESQLRAAVVLVESGFKAQQKMIAAYRTGNTNVPESVHRAIASARKALAESRSDE
jgi:hypothetical protein